MNQITLSIINFKFTLMCNQFSECLCINALFMGWISKNWYFNCKLRDPFSINTFFFWTINFVKHSLTKFSGQISSVFKTIYQKHRKKLACGFPLWNIQSKLKTECTQKSRQKFCQLGNELLIFYEIFHNFQTNSAWKHLLHHHPIEPEENVS